MSTTNTKLEFFVFYSILSTFCSSPSWEEINDSEDEDSDEPNSDDSDDNESDDDTKRAVAAMGKHQFSQMMMAAVTRKKMVVKMNVLILSCSIVIVQR